MSHKWKPELCRYVPLPNNYTLYHIPIYKHWRKTKDSAGLLRRDFRDTEEPQEKQNHINTLSKTQNILLVHMRTTQVKITHALIEQCMHGNAWCMHGNIKKAIWLTNAHRKKYNRNKHEANSMKISTRFALNKQGASSGDHWIPGTTD